ncbi:MAG: YiaA/YiaB family inner membrane protein [Bacteroidota bacterium]
MQNTQFTKNTAAWKFQVWASFILAIGLTIAGIVQMEADFWIRGYLIMGLMFTVGTSFTLSKTIRDEHEASQIVNQVRRAKTEKMLSEMDDTLS